MDTATDERKARYDELLNGGDIALGFEAFDDAIYAWRIFTSAKTPLDQASALVELANRMSDLESWHPLHNINNGEVEWPDH